MSLLDALLRLCFGLPPTSRLLAAAQVNIWFVAWALVDRATSGAIPLSADIRRMLRQRLDDCAMCLKLAIFERAWEIAGISANLPGDSARTLSRVAGLSARDISSDRLIARARSLLSLIERFEELAQRHAARLTRLAVRKQAGELASAVPAIALETTQGAEPQGEPCAALVTPCTQPAGQRISVPP